MDKYIVKIALLSFALALTGCVTYPNQHGTGSVGVRADVDVFGVGVDAAAGVHRASGGQNGTANGGVVCGRTHAAMEASQGLISWASNGGQGEEIRRAQANAHEYPGGAGYNCSAQHTGQSRQVNGQESPPGRMQQQQFQGQQQMQYVPGQQELLGGRRSYYGQ